MKKKSKLVLGVCLAIGLAIVFSGCASTEVYNSFMDKELPVREHALLLVDRYIALSMIDGELQLKAGTASQNKSKMFLLIPGTHSFTLVYVRDNGSTISKSDSGGVGLSGDFLAGHIYRITAEISDNKISFHLNEENDKSIWDSKEVASIKPPKQGRINANAISQSAAANAPSELEGTWILLNIPQRGVQFGIEEMMYTFTGSAYTFVSKRKIPSDQLTVVNDSRKRQGLPLLTLGDTLQGGTRGTISIKGNTITASQIQTSDDLQSWQNMPQPAQTIYEYSFNTEGNLLLKATKIPIIDVLTRGYFGKGETAVLVKKAE